MCLYGVHLSSDRQNPQKDSEHWCSDGKKCAGHVTCGLKCRLRIACCDPREVCCKAPVSWNAERPPSAGLPPAHFRGGGKGNQCLQTRFLDEKGENSSPCISLAQVPVPLLFPPMTLQTPQPALHGTLAGSRRKQLLSRLSCSPQLSPVLMQALVCLFHVCSCQACSYYQCID